MTKRRTIAISVLCMIAVLIGGFILGALVFTVDQYGKNWNWDFWSIAGFAVSILSILFGTFILFKAGKEYTTTLEDELKANKACQPAWALIEERLYEGKKYKKMKLYKSKKDAINAFNKAISKCMLQHPENKNTADPKMFSWRSVEPWADDEYYELRLESLAITKKGAVAIVDDDHTNNNEKTDKEES